MQTDPILPSPVQPQPITDQPTGFSQSKKSRKRRYVIMVISVIVVVLVCAGAFFAWYRHSITPISNDINTSMSIKIVSGATSSEISTLLQEKKLIRSAKSFDIYTKLSGTRNQLRAGSYKLSPASSVPEIVDTLIAGKVEEFEITFLPGATVAGARAVLLAAGYDVAEIDAALSERYDHPVFADKPSTADLEGYIFGETYSFPVGTTVEQVLMRTFDELYNFVQNNSLQEGYRAKGLTLFEGITLASIIQREVISFEDQQKAAQVFYKRLAEDMPLGSDATFIYAAEKLGVKPTVDLDSPYNTRIYGGLTPGPIATPSTTALLAVAQPSSGDYLYFINGDDDINYFARTLEEHEANIANHCDIKCNLL